MTENLLHKLEEKMMLLVSEIEQARKQIEKLINENTILKTEKEKSSNKLHELLSLLDALDTDNQVSAETTLTRPVLLTQETVTG